MQAVRSTRPGGYVGYVGVPHGVELNGQELFYCHVHLHGGPAPVRRYLPTLINLAWNGKIEPGKVFDLVLSIRWRRAICHGRAPCDQDAAVLLCALFHLSKPPGFAAPCRATQSPNAGHHVTTHSSRKVSTVIRLTVNGKAITATLIDSETARDFISLLPLTLTMNDLCRREKFANLPRTLSNEGRHKRTYATLRDSMPDRILPMAMIPGSGMLSSSWR
jgi:Cyclophilin-like family